MYEKIQEKLVEIGSQQNFIIKSISNWAKRVSLQHHLNVMAGNHSTSIQYLIAKNLFLAKVKRALGFDRCISFGSGAAPLSIDTKKYFLSLDLPIFQIYALSESSGCHSFSVVGSPSLETIGKGMPGTLTKIRDPDVNGHGEMMIKGRHVFMGYVNEEEKTYEALTEDGWLMTGDIAFIDDDGYIFITGRLKELIITAGGENIPPNHIEQLVKSELPAVSNVVLIGEGKKYLTVLLTLKTLISSETGIAKDDLSVESIKWMKELNLKYTTVSEIINAGPDATVLRAIQDGIDRANKNAISNAQKIQKFRILSHDFSIPTGEYGPTMKIKRNFVIEKYRGIIDSMY